MRLQTTLSFGLSLTTLLTAAATAQETPLGAAFTYQGQLAVDGQLLDCGIDDPCDDGTPAPDCPTIRFELFDGADPLASSPVGAPVVLQVEVVEGLFSAKLDFGVNVFNGSDRWLEVTVMIDDDGDLIEETLCPRQCLTGTPYALQTRGMFVNEDGDVGIGETDPLCRMHVESQDQGLAESALLGESMIVESEDAVLGLYSERQGSFGSAISMGELDAAGGFLNKWGIFRRTSSGSLPSQLRFTYGSDKNYALNPTHLMIGPDGNVGIGTNTPAARLDVAGSIVADSVRATENLGETAAPEPGGLHADNVVYAWARVLGNGQLQQSYGIENVIRTNQGVFQIIYKTDLPGGSVVTVTPNAVNDPVIANCFAGPGLCTVYLKLFLNGSFVPHDESFYIQVVGRP